jgi:hypothetical protein
MGTKDLNISDYIALNDESWVDRKTIEAWRIYRVNSADGATLIGRDHSEDYAGIVFPVYWPGDPYPKEYFLRRDHPTMEAHNGTLKAKQKYLAPPGRGNRLLFGPGELVGALADTKLPILLVEGLKKTVAAYRLSRWNTETPRFLPCGISGVWNFRGTVGKTTDWSGERVSIKGPIPDLGRVIWNGRSVFLVYDSDVVTNRSVSAAREALAAELKSRGAQVVAMCLPTLDELPKTGFDDLLARWGPQAVLDWLKLAHIGAAEVCDDPEPIPLDLLKLPKFDVDNLIPTPWLCDMIDATSRATETPVELALTLSLGVIAASVQRKYITSPEPGYIEQTNLWMIPALESGNRKTAVLKELTAPLLGFERSYQSENAHKIAESEAARRLAEERVKSLRQKAARAKSGEFENLKRQLLEAERDIPPVLRHLRVWTQDVTPEQLGPLMSDQGEKIAILSDEGGFFDILAGRYSNGVPNLDLILQSYSGSPHRVDRSSRAPVFLNRPALTLVLSPQPSVLKGLATAPGFRGRGLLARPLYALPESTLGFRTLVPQSIPENVQHQYWRSIEALLKLPPRIDENPHAIHFSQEAYAEWKLFQKEVEEKMRYGGPLEHVRDWASKLPGNTARIAAVLHCAHYAESSPESYPLSVETMDAALSLGCIFEPHALAVFSLMAVDPSMEGAQKVWGWIEEGRHKSFSRRDCFQALRGSFHNVESLQPALSVLVERSYIFPLASEKQVGRPSAKYRVNRRFNEGWQ